MEKISKIIVACDFSKYTNEILDHAVIMARQLNADLIAVNVINQRDIDAITYAINQNLMVEKTTSPDHFVRQFKENRLASLKELIEKTAYPQLFRKKIITVGVPFKALIDVIQSENADMIIMGSKGRSAIKDVLIGSTAERMFRYSPIPIYCIPIKKSG